MSFVKGRRAARIDGLRGALGAALLVACAGDEPAETGLDSAPPAAAVEYNEGTLGDDGERTWRVARLAGDAPLGVLIVGPTDPAEARYDGAAPLAILSHGSFVQEPDCGPGPKDDVEYQTGGLYLRAIPPGACCYGICSEGRFDAGGPASQEGIADLLRFALGRVETTQGLTISDLAPVPPLEGAVVVMASSASASVTLPGLARAGDALDGLAGIALYETPLFPEAVSGTLGRLALDGDPSTDADGNGFAWDDGRNPRYAIGDCAGDACDLDLSQLAWDPATAYVGEAGDTYAGSLFFDGDGDGTYDSRSGSPDVDGDGALSTDEDFAVHGSSSGGRFYVPPVILREALERGIIAESSLPGHVASLAESEAYWDEREGFGAISAIHAARPEIPWLIVASDQDHGVPQPTRPHVVAAYQWLDALGASVKLNPEADLLREVSGAGIPNYAPRGWNDPLTESDVNDGGLAPLSAGREWTRAAAVVELWGEAWE